MSDRDRVKKGLIYAVAAMVMAGMLPVAANYAVRTINPLLFGGLVTFLGSLPFLLQIKLSGNLRTAFSSKFGKPIFGITLFATLAGVCFFTGTKLTSGINTGLLVQIEPVYSLILASLLLGEVISMGQIFGTLLVVLGAGIVAYKGPAALNLGDALILITPIFYQLSHVFSKKLIPLVPALEVIPAVRLFYSGLALTIFALILDPASITDLTRSQWMFIILSSLAFRFLDLTLWYRTLKYLPLGKASGFLPLSLAASFLGAVWFLGETPTTGQYAGLVLILLGTISISWITWKNASNG